MRRTILLLAGVLLCVAALGSDSPKDYDDTLKIDPLEGTWQLIDIEDTGKRWDPGIKMTLTYRGATLTINYGDGDILQGKCRIDTARNPSHLNWMESKRDTNSPAVAKVRRSVANLNWPYGDKVQPAKLLYQIDGDTLRIAKMSHAKEEQRPQDFNDDGIFIYTFKRVK